MVAERSQRQLRVCEIIRHALSEVFLRAGFHDERLFDVSVTVTEVQVSPDLKNATVFVMPLAKKDPEIIVKALNEPQNNKYLRGAIAKKIHLKFTPRLRFELDDTFENSSKIEAVLRSDHVRQDLDD